MILARPTRSWQGRVRLPPDLDVDPRARPARTLDEVLTHLQELTRHIHEQATPVSAPISGRTPLRSKSRAFESRRPVWEFGPCFDFGRGRGFVSFWSIEEIAGSWTPP